MKEIRTLLIMRSRKIVSKVVTLFFMVCFGQTISMKAMQAPAIATSVCAVMKELNTLNGKLVTIRSLLVSVDNNSVFSVLVPLPNESCTAPGYSEPAQIHIRYPDVHLLKNPSKGYQFDRESLLQTQQKIQEALQRKPRQLQFIVVVEGVLSVTQYGPPIPPETYRDAWYPAHLDIQKYRSIEERLR